MANEIAENLRRSPFTDEARQQSQQYRAEPEARFEAIRRANTIPPIHSLTVLHDWVLASDPHRTPKWRFRIASDFGLEIQPEKRTRRRRRQTVTRSEKYEFACRALFTEDIGIGALSVPAHYLGREGRRYFEQGFSIVSGEPRDDQWHLRFNSFMYSSRETSGDYQQWLRAARDEAEPRIRTVLTDGTFNRLHPGMMLSLSCLRCGKALTDPVSQARLIGPECAQTSAAALPFIVDLEGKAGRWLNLAEALSDPFYRRKSPTTQEERTTMKPLIDSANDLREAIEQAVEQWPALCVDREELTKTLCADCEFGPEFPGRPTPKAIRFMVDLQLGEEPDYLPFDQEDATDVAQKLLDALHEVIAADFKPSDISRLPPTLQTRFVRLFAGLAAQVEATLMAFIDEVEDEKTNGIDGACEVDHPDADMTGATQGLTA